jgi:acyl-coenzyme A thioesterase PaaI-like protein
MNAFSRLPGLLRRARTSPLWLALLNRLLWRVIPFNRPHRIRIEALADGEVRTVAPYRRSSFNHLRGTHACAIATVAEFSSGLLLLSLLDPSRYRLIMARLEVDYRYQAKTDIVAATRLSPAELEAQVLVPLQSQEVLLFTLPTEVHDRAGNLVARAVITWQVKAWSQVKTQGGGA